MRKKPYLESERRRYIRLEPKEPVSVRFKVVEESRGSKVAATDQAKTRSMSAGGMFLEIPLLKPEMLEGLLKGTHLLFLEIDIPDAPHPIKALARVIWVEGEKGKKSDRYGVGVSFLSIKEDDRDKIMNYVIDTYSG